MNGQPQVGKNPRLTMLPLSAGMSKILTSPVSRNESSGTTM